MELIYIHINLPLSYLYHMILYPSTFPVELREPSPGISFCLDGKSILEVYFVLRKLGERELISQVQSRLEGCSYAHAQSGL